MDWIEHPSPSNFFFFAFFGRDLIFLRTPSSVLTRPESLLRENTSSLGRSGGGEGKDGIVIIFPHESDATPTCLSLNPFVVVFSYSSTRRILQTNGKTSPADHPIFISRHPSFLLSHPNPLPSSSIILPHEKTLSFFHYYSTPPQFILPPQTKSLKKTNHRDPAREGTSTISPTASVPNSLGATAGSSARRTNAARRSCQTTRSSLSTSTRRPRSARTCRCSSSRTESWCAST